MKRVAGAVVCAVLLATAGLAPATGWPQDGSRAVAAECTWKQHAKRVVKHVRRHGKLRRVVRTRHLWSCDPLPTAPVSGPPAAPSSPPAGPSQPEPEANWVGVSAHDQGGDLGYVLTRPRVRTGKVTVELNNQGEDPHNLNLQREGGGEEPVYQFANTLPAHQEVASFELPPGTYRLWCSLTDHDEKGMHTTLVVE